MRISDWSSDVCSSDLLFVENDEPVARVLRANIDTLAAATQAKIVRGSVLTLGPARAVYDLILLDPPYGTGAGCRSEERRVGKGVSVRVDLGGGRLLKNKNYILNYKPNI